MRVKRRPERERIVQALDSLFSGFDLLNTLLWAFGVEGGRHKLGRVRLVDYHGASAHEGSGKHGGGGDRDGAPSPPEGARKIVSEEAADVRAKLDIAGRVKDSMPAAHQVVQRILDLVTAGEGSSLGEVASGLTIKAQCLFKLRASEDSRLQILRLVEQGGETVPA